MKTWLQRGVSLLLICLLAGPIAIQADTIEKIILTAKENQVDTVLIPSDTKDTIRSLQLSFQIKAKQGKVLKEHVQFRFHRDIKSDVQEWRYQEDTGRLTIYLSGDEHLYAQDELRQCDFRQNLRNLDEQRSLYPVERKTIRRPDQYAFYPVRHLHPPKWFHRDFR